MPASSRPLSERAWLILLLLIVCLPRAAIDAYLPALPAMADALHATDAQMQSTLTTYMAGYAASMLIMGPLSDRYGRRPVLLAGLAVYVAATLACALATSVPALVAARVIQALGGCGGAVIGRVIVRERFDAKRQVALLSALSAGMALSPVIAPLAGSAVAAVGGWRAVFVMLAIGGVAGAWFTWRLLPETRGEAIARAAGAHPLRGLGATYARLLRNRHFLRYSLSISFVYCTYFPFIAGSSALFQRRLHLSDAAYAAVFGITVSGYPAGSALYRRMHARMDADAVLARAVRLNLAAAAALCALNLGHAPSALTLVAPMFVAMVAVGIAIPACQFAVLQPFPEIAGAASGLFFFIQMAITALCGALLDRLTAAADGSAVPLIAMTAAASLAFAGGFTVLRTRDGKASARIGGPAQGAAGGRAD
ncbi:multidrug effflux MFS transporter [Burkholderia sp. 3C]